MIHVGNEVIWLYYIIYSIADKGSRMSSGVIIFLEKLLKKFRRDR